MRILQANYNLHDVVKGYQDYYENDLKKSGVAGAVALSSYYLLQFVSTKLAAEGLKTPDIEKMHFPILLNRYPETKVIDHLLTAIQLYQQIKIFYNQLTAANEVAKTLKEQADAVAEDNRIIHLPTLLRYAKTLEGQTLLTTAQKKAFRITILAKGIEITPLSSNKSRLASTANINDFLQQYNTSFSLAPSHYTDMTRNSVYLVSLIEAMQHSPAPEKQ